MRRLMQVFTLRSSNSARERPSGSNLGTPELRPCADGLEMDRSKADAVDRSACLGHCPPSLNREEGSQKIRDPGAGLTDRQTESFIIITDATFLFRVSKCFELYRETYTRLSPD